MRINQRRFHVFTRPPEREGAGGGLGSTQGQGLWEGGEGTERQSKHREGGAGRPRTKPCVGRDRQAGTGASGPGNWSTPGAGLYAF